VRCFPVVARPISLTIVLVIGIFAFLGAAFAFALLCDGGYSLMLLGGAVGCLGMILYRTGAWATVIPFAIIVLCLVGGGYYGLTVAGCGL